MISNKSFTENAHQVIINASLTAKAQKRNMCTIDILLGIFSETTSFAGRVLRENGVNSSSINSLYNGINSLGRPEGFTLESFCNFANSIAETSEDNAIAPEHMLLAILANKNNFAMTALTQSNLNSLEIESSLVEYMGRPGFLFSYLYKEDFWDTHFNRWIKMNPFIASNNWNKFYSDSVKGAMLAYVSENKQCGLIVKESKNSEFIINTNEEPVGKMLIITGTRRHVPVVQTCFLAFALGRLAFKEDKV